MLRSWTTMVCSTKQMTVKNIACNYLSAMDHGVLWLVGLRIMTGTWTPRKWCGTLPALPAEYGWGLHQSTRRQPPINAEQAASSNITQFNGWQRSILCNNRYVRRTFACRSLATQLLPGKQVQAITELWKWPEIWEVPVGVGNVAGRSGYRSSWERRYTIRFANVDNWPARMVIPNWTVSERGNK